MSPNFKKQIDILSISEIEGFQSWIEKRLSRDPLSLKERESLRNLRIQIIDYLKSIREKL